MFCGYKQTGPKVLSPEERKEKEDADFKRKCRENELEYLLTTRNKLVKFSMFTTGCPTLDANIVKHHGDWLSPVMRAAVTAFNDAWDYQVRHQQLPEREETLRLALLYGRQTTTASAIERVVMAHTWERYVETCTTQ